MSQASGASGPQQQIALVLAAVNAVRAIPTFRAAQPSTVANAIGLLMTRDVMGFTPLHHAAASGERELLGKLLAVLVHVRGAWPPLETTDKAGRTALFWAVERGHSGIIKDLIDAGANPSSEDADGRSVLQCAIECSRSAGEKKGFYHDMIRYLLQSGADVGSQDQQGASAVHAAAAAGDGELLSILVELGGAPLNLRDQDGETAMFWAVRERQFHVLSKLLAYGIDAAASNDSGENVVDFARSLGDEEAVQQLQTALQPAPPVQQTSTDKMDLTASGSSLFASSSSGGIPAMWSSNPAHLISH